MDAGLTATPLGRNILVKEVVELVAGAPKSPQYMFVLEPAKRFKPPRCLSERRRRPLVLGGLNGQACGRVRPDSSRRGMVLTAFASSSFSFSRLRFMKPMTCGGKPSSRSMHFLQRKTPPIDSGVFKPTGAGRSTSLTRAQRAIRPLVPWAFGDHRCSRRGWRHRQIQQGPKC